MSYISEHIKLPRALDRRVRLTKEDKEDIRARYKQGEIIRGIARAYKGICSRRLIQFIIFPERLKAVQDRNREQQHWKKYYNRKQLTQAVANLRRYKQDLYLKGIIK